MKRKITIILSWLLCILGASPGLLAQTAGIYESYIVLNVNNSGNQFYDLAATTPNPNFDGQNLGIFANTQSLVISGGQNKTFKSLSGGCNVSNGILHYRVYPQGSPTGSFIGINLPFDQNLSGAPMGSQNQQWGMGGANAYLTSPNLVASLANGNYTLEVYTSAAYQNCVGNSPSTGTAFSSNLGANYKADFTIFNPPVFGTDIVSENALPGNPASEWELPSANAGDLSIQGYATDISYNRGTTARFKINTNASAYTIKIYRLGYYQGNGARYIADATVTATLPQTQPNCLTESATGLVDCGNWAESATWNIPSNAVSGIYIAKLTRTDTQGSSHIAFIVRNDASTSDLFFQTSDATWQAYNGYGGNSLYTGSVPGFPSGHASKVSYNRPFITRSGGAGGGAQEDWLFNSEYPMLRWLERNGYDVSYTTNVDTERFGSLILQHKVFMSVGHDEYWSKEMRNNVVAARNAGVHLAFFSGNEVYWKTRHEPSIDGSNTPYRTLVCYKEGPGGENTTGVKSDPTPEWTGLWRYGCAPEYNPATNNACKPENELTGQISWDGSTGTMQVSSDYKNLRFWRNSPVAALGTGQTLNLTQNSLGYEWNPYQAEFANFYPKGRIILSLTQFNNKTHQLSLYKHTSGAWVFGAGTVQWSWGLDNNHDRGNEAVSPAMQQATVNLFADMGVQPTTLQGDLVSASASTDTQAPIVVINSPVQNGNVPNNTQVVISGTASDVGGTVAGVEVSLDGGTTWQVANGTSTWTFTWTPTALGPATIQARAFDDSGNMEVPTTVGSNVITVNVINPPPPACPCNIFGNVTPSFVTSDASAVELGVKFRSNVAGYITGIRFFKSPLNTGTHVGRLWSSTGGSPLAIATFTGETASGWQEVTFNNPVAIDANTTYIASYHTTVGRYAFAENFFQTSGTFNNPLLALQNGAEGPNGVYKYGAGGIFPDDTYNSGNYYVDVIFVTEVGPDTTPPAVSAISPINNAINVNINNNINITFNEAIDPTTINSTTVSVAGVSAVVSYDAPSRTATINPNSALSPSTTYNGTVLSGSGGVKDLDYNFTFTTQAPPPPPLGDFNQGPGGPILVISSTLNPFSRYSVEILRAEGLNEFAVSDISSVNTSLLNSYDVIILGEIPLNSSQVTMFSDWLNAGGTLIAFRPDADLAGLMGITINGGTLDDKYLAIANTGAGVGIVNQTMQYHGSADLYTLNGATALATLYSTANGATSNPAVTQNLVGSNGGKAIAFAFDLAKSIVYTRQGNPAWAGQERDGQSGPIRANDMFFPDWLDFNKVQIPQADEQQRFLANLILQSNAHKKPLPRFWYLPRKLKAAVVMTGDDHASGGTIGRFNQYLALSPSNTAQAVADWTAIRGTSYIYSNTAISDAQALAFENQGFEISIHLNTNCASFTETSLINDFDTQLAQFAVNYPSISSPKTHRTHCIAWSDWATKPKVEVTKGIRLNTDYYYWPDTWIQNRPGMFTGSGMPMRFADLDGSLIDNYQVTTQLTDESGITYSTHINTLLDNAVGATGYYGVFCANMHTDVNGGNSTQGSDAIIAAAQARNVPVISAKQMLTWLDGRNNSSFGNMTWSGNALSFTASVFNGAHLIYGMLPYNHNGGQLQTLTLNGGGVSFTTEIIKGIEYAFFPTNTGNYVATYGIDNVPPQISNIISTPAQGGNATIAWTTDENATSQVIYGTDANNLNLSASNPNPSTSHSFNLTGLTGNTTYFYRVISTDAASNSITNPNPPTTPLSFVMPAAPAPPCFQDQVLANFNAGTGDANILITNSEGGEIQLKPTVYQDFTTLPSTTEWQSFPWNVGGTSTISNGQIVVDGARFNNNAGLTFSAGTTVEFAATFANASFQHVGFGGGNDNAPAEIFNTSPWAVFSTGSAGSAVQARCWDGGSFLDYTIPLSLLGTQHNYKIEWKASVVDFYVDGNLVHSQSVVINTPMRLAISDYNNGGANLSVDWISATPYLTPGVFTSRVYDAGSLKNWEEVNWTATTPAGTSLQVAVREGNTANPDGSWTAFAPITNGANAGGTSRYIQYQVTLATTNTSVSPIFKDITINCESPSNTAPQITLQPTNQTKCEGEPVSFSSTASGIPTPTIQWQVSEDNGSNWVDLIDEVNPTFTMNALSIDNNKQYRAVWTNAQGIVNSDVATLIVNPLPTATISLFNPAICEGDIVELRLDNATGTGPFDLTVNGNTYNDVNVGTSFAFIDPYPTQSIWNNTFVPAGTLSITDGQALEVGVKFRTSVAGYVKGVRFYKGTTNTGTHIGKLWTSTGTLLSQATFVNETADGWQEVRFSAPIFIQANTTYIASYFSPNGYFAINPGGMTGGFTNGNITLLANGIDGPNSVFKYIGGTGGFPDQSGSGANYSIDIVFSPSLSSALNLNYELTSVKDANECVSTGTPLQNLSVIINPLPNGTITAANPTISIGQTANLIFNATSGNAPFDLIINGNPYTGVQPNTPFSVGVPTIAPANPIKIFPNNSTPANPNANDGGAIEVGVKFQSEVAGKITGIRFYKGTSNTGSHTGNLWTSTGTNLGSVVFTNETADGWQEVSFASPISIQANTTYIASYLSSGGGYAFTGAGLATQVLNLPLKTVADGAKGVYQVGGGFPTQTFNNANYWVDVNFVPNGQLVNYNLTQITSGNCLNVVNLTTSVFVEYDNTAPSAPAVTTGTVTETSVQLNWGASNDNIGVTEYEVFQNNVSIGTTPNLTFNVTGLTACTAYTFIVKAKDAAGNVSDASNTLNINTLDSTPPVTPTLANATGECSVTVTAPTTTDACAGTITGTTSNPLTYSTQGTYQITWTFDDGNGNQTTAVQTVVVDDVTPPTTPTIADATGKCSVTVTAPTTTDACAGTITGTTINPLTYSTQGTYQITWTFDDGNGNQTTAVQTVVVDDVTPPTTPTIASATGECSVTVTAPTTNDACAGTITGTTSNPLTYSTQGTYQITWTFDDGNGNQTTAIQTVVVDDVTPPTTPTIASATGECSVTVTAPTTTDACAGTITGTTSNPLTYSTQGTYQITWTFDDGNGNQTTAVQTVVVDDVTPPTTPTIADATGECSVTVTAPTTTDACAGTITGTTINPLTYSTQGTYQITWTFDDGNGNQTTAVQTVVVDDVTAPIITLTGSSLIAVEAGDTYTELGATANDNCDGSLSVTIGGDVVNNLVVGSYNITYNVSDASGNAANQVTRSVVVQDGTAPIITLNGNATINVECGQTYTELGATAVDNTQTSISVVIGGDIVNPSVNGVYYVTYNATDGEGNVATEFIRTVTVSDNTAPITPTIANATGECSVTVTAPTTTDNCAGTITGTTSNPLTYSLQGTYQITWTFDDGNGNQTTAVQTVVVDDVTPPTTPTLANATGECSVTVTAPTTTDACAGTITGATTDSLTYSLQGTYQITWTFNDGNGNQTTAIQTVEVDDVTPPTTPTLANATGECSVTVTAPTTNDACAGTITGTTSNPLTYSTQGTYQITWTFNDGNGNQTTAIQTVVVDDVTAPVIALNGNSTITLEAGSVYTELGASVNDNCASGLSVVIGGDVVNTSFVGTYVITYNANDGNGNNATQITRTVNVQDTTPPTAPTLSVGTITTTSIQLNWSGATDNVGVTNYEVYQGASLINTLNTTTFTVNSLTPNTAYTFTVKAKDAQGNTSNASNAVNPTTLPAPVVTTRIEAETNFTKITDADNDVIVTSGGGSSASGFWSNNLGVVLPDVNIDKIRISFNVATSGQYILKARVRAGTTASPTLYWVPNRYVFALNNSPITLVGNPATLSPASAVFTGSFFGTMESSTLNLTSGNYTLDVNATRTTGAVDYLELVRIGGSVDTQAPTAPVLSLQSKTSTTVNLVWTAATDNVGVSGYEVFNGATLVGTPTATNFSVSGLSPNTAYTFSVKAKDVAGNTSLASNLLNVTTDPIPTTVRIEAENNFTVVNDPNLNIISTNGGGAIALSNGLGVRLPDLGDKIRVNFTVNTAGQYIIRARVRSGIASSATIFWDSPSKYTTTVDEIPTVFTPILSSNTGPSATFGGSFFGTMETAILNLTAGSHYASFQAVNRAWGAVDYIELVSALSLPITIKNPELNIAKADDGNIISEVMNVYPNPNTTGNFNLSLSNEIRGEVKIEVLDPLGMLVVRKTIKVAGSEISLDISEIKLKNGIYFLKIEGKNLQPKVIKLVKE
jgi:hypothetical protein